MHKFDAGNTSHALCLRECNAQASARKFKEFTKSHESLLGEGSVFREKAGMLHSRFLMSLFREALC
jgi:hypothetical protein